MSTIEWLETFRRILMLPSSGSIHTPCYVKVISILRYHSRLVVPRDFIQLGFPSRDLNVLLDFWAMPEAKSRHSHSSLSYVASAQSVTTTWHKFVNFKHLEERWPRQINTHGILRSAERLMYLHFKCFQMHLFLITPNTAHSKLLWRTKKQTLSRN
jgi:hypothetical protein